MQVEQTLRDLASKPISQQSAADSLGVSLDKFRQLLATYPAVDWAFKVNAETRAKIKADSRPMADIAKDYGIHTTTVWRIKRK